MGRALVLLLSLTAATEAGAIVISKDYDLPAAEIGFFEKQVRFARRIRSQSTEPYPIFLADESDRGFGIACDAGFPTEALEGCRAWFSFRLGDVNVAIQKRLPAPGFAAKVAEQLSKLDPATTEEHVHFGSPFESAAGDGTHYYCEPRRKDSVPAEWKCTLHVSEEFVPRQGG